MATGLQGQAQCAHITIGTAGIVGLARTRPTLLFVRAVYREASTVLESVRLDGTKATCFFVAWACVGFPTTIQFFVAPSLAVRGCLVPAALPRFLSHRFCSPFRVLTVFAEVFHESTSTTSFLWQAPPSCRCSPDLLCQRGALWVRSPHRSCAASGYISLLFPVLCSGCI